jgi:antirestriction protein ArdC
MVIGREHAQYFNSWLKVLDQDPKAFSSAVSKAQCAADYLIEFNERKQAAYIIHVPAL